MSRLDNTDEWTLIPFPGSTARVLVAYGPSYSVLKSTPEKQLAAWLFARWLLSPENQAQWVDASALFPLGKLDHHRGAHPRSGRRRSRTCPWRRGCRSWPPGARSAMYWRMGPMSFFKPTIPVDQIPSVLTEMDSTAKEISDK